MNKYLAGAGVAALTLMAVSAAHAAFPAIGADTLGPAVTFTFNANGTVTTTSSAQGPYDGVEDTYFGVVNNTKATLSSFTISSTIPGVFAFESDGIDASSYLNIPHNAMDTTGYGGPNAFFTNLVSGPLNTGTVNFIVPIAANGGMDIFSLEQNAGANGVRVGVPEPATWALMLIGIGGVGYAARRRAAKLATASI